MSNSVDLPAKRNIETMDGPFMLYIETMDRPFMLNVCYTEQQGELLYLPLFTATKRKELNW